MAKPKGLELSKSNVSQTINLEELLGVSFRGQKDLRLAIAQAVIDHIVKRTREENKDLNGKRFTKYSKDYIESTVFSVLKDSTTPNMELTGAMLASIGVLKDGPNTIQIGYDDQEEILKAYNHNVGDTVPARKFFGITNDDAKKLIEKEFKSDLARLKGRDPNKTTVSEILSRGILSEASEAARQIVTTFTTLDDFDAG